MKKFLLILLANFALGANLLQYELFNHDDSVDIVLSFDRAYEPDVTRTIDGQSMSLILKNLGSDEKYNEMRTNQKVLKGFTITPKGNNVEINFPTGANLIANAISKDDKLKLSINIKNPNFDQSQMSVSGNNESENTSDEPKKGSAVSFGWILPLIVALLFVGVILVFVRKFKAFRSSRSIDDTWEKFDSSVLERPNEDENSIDDGREIFAPHSDEISDEVAQNISFTQELGEEKSYQELAQNDDTSEEIDEVMDFDEDEDEEVEQIQPIPNEISPKSSFQAELKERLEAKSDKISAFKHVLQDELTQKIELSANEATVEFIKEIDENNTAVVIKFNGKKHLVVLKNSNIIE